MIRFDIFANPLYFIFFSDIEEDTSVEDDNIEEEIEKTTLEILAEKLNQESMLGNYPLIEGVVRLKSILEGSKSEEKIQKKLAIDKETIVNLNQFSIFKDEIHNVIDILEKIENDELTDIDFLELRACDHSCAGGALVVNNRFLTIERLRKRMQASKHEQQQPDFDDRNFC